MAFDVPSDPASGFGQNHNVGRARSWMAKSVSVVSRWDCECSVVTGCCITTRYPPDISTRSPTPPYFGKGAKYRAGPSRSEAARSMDGHPVTRPGDGD